MSSLEDAYSWYRAVQRCLQNMKQIGGKYWDEPYLWADESPLTKEERFKRLSTADILNDIRAASDPLADLAIFVFFSAFEVSIREMVEKQIEKDLHRLRHPFLRGVRAETVGLVRRGSFAKVLNHLKSLDADLIEQVRQVRRYRNWVAHGRPAARQPPEAVSPELAYGRLSRCLDLLRERESGGSPDDTTRDAP